MGKYEFLFFVLVWLMVPNAHAEDSEKSSTKLLKEYERQFPETTERSGAYCRPGTEENTRFRKLSSRYRNSTDPQEKFEIRKKMARIILGNERRANIMTAGKIPLCEGWTFGAEPSEQWIRIHLSHIDDPSNSNFIIPK